MFCMLFTICQVNHARVSISATPTLIQYNRKILTMDKSIMRYHHAPSFSCFSPISSSSFLSCFETSAFLAIVGITFHRGYPHLQGFLYTFSVIWLGEKHPCFVLQSTVHQQKLPFEAHSAVLITQKELVERCRVHKSLLPLSCSCLQ